MDETLMTQEGVLPIIFYFNWLIKWKGTMELMTWVV